MRVSIKKIISSKEFRNITWMIADRLWRMGISLVVGIWMVRYLGPDSYGQINYALAFIGIATVITNLGMESFLIKELVNIGEEKPKVVYSAFKLRMLAAFIVFTALFVFLQFTEESPSFYLLFFLLVPQLFTNAFAVVDIAFQAELQSRITVICRNSFFVLGALLKVIAILTHQNIYIFAVLVVLDVILADTVLFFYYKKKHPTGGVGKLEVSFMKELFLKAVPFLISNVAIVIYMKIDQILLGKLATIKEVGFFTAATKVTEVFYFIPLVITGSVYSLLINSKRNSIQEYLMNAKKIFMGLLIISVLISIIVFFFSKSIIGVLFGFKFLSSIAVLQVYIWVIILIFAGVAFNQLLVIEELQRIILFNTIIGVILNIGLNIFLIPKYGALGAGVATIITQFVSCIGANFFFPKSRLIFLKLFLSPSHKLIVGK